MLAPSGVCMAKLPVVTLTPLSSFICAEPTCHFAQGRKLADFTTPLFSKVTRGRSV
ncbi:hypothetical protein PGT21_035232 [Puccinia graminis f. sp. tritici]|uniref:Uncharacterized protein n=1 Tax=Puccinia graminis f. sp. tritici TaxID=56615 RepID=A0A5B0MAR9_PUCGR|nr:hypothetical protein PGTUg99_024239 [Puccinia graminis f. sp. tritici]KAA1084767.1 hypothetical protein PGT21_035232 [Puccinia graminis f. sp. tritici]